MSSESSESSESSGSSESSRRRRSRTAVFLAASASLALASAAGVASSTLEASTELDAEFGALLEEHGLAGVVWATVDGERVVVGARGLADASTGAPLRPDSRVHVGSVAKTLLATAILRRVTQGALSLDAPVESLLPDLALDNPWRATHLLRLRHLLDMTGGLDDLRLWHVFGTRSRPDDPLRVAFDDDPGTLRLRTAPGSRYSYSNLGYTLAARVLEASVGERYEDWAERELLQPLGLRDSRFHYARPGVDPGGDTRLAWGHVEGGVPVVTPPTALRPAAQFLTTAADMARLARFLMSDGRVDGSVFVRRDLLAAMGRPTTTEAARAGLRVGYALGLSARDRHGAVGKCHGGSVAGFRAMFCLYPESGRAFFVAHNADDEDAPYDRFDARLVEALGLRGTATPRVPGGVPVIERGWSGRYVPDPSRHSQAELADRLFGAWTLSFGEAGASLRIGSGAARPLERVGPGLYRLPERVQASLVLLRDPQGRVRIDAGHLSLRRIGALEHAALWTAVAGGALALSWWLAAVPLRAWRRPGAWREVPAGWAAVALVIAGAAFALQPWQRFADLTGASLAWQAWFAWRELRAGARPLRGVLDAAAAGFGLALCGVLAAFGAWPLATWRF